jgi:hypothetical protein
MVLAVTTKLAVHLLMTVGSRVQCRTDRELGRQAQPAFSCFVAQSRLPVWLVATYPAIAYTLCPAPQ